MRRNGSSQDWLEQWAATAAGAAVVALVRRRGGLLALRAVDAARTGRAADAACDVESAPHLAVIECWALAQTLARRGDEAVGS